MDQGCKSCTELIIAFYDYSNVNPDVRLSFVTKMKGKQQPTIEQCELDEKAAVREKTRRPSQQTAAHPTLRLLNARSNFEY